MLAEGDTHRVPKMSLFPTVKAGKKKILGGHTMKTNLAIVALLFMASFSASAQAPIRKDPLLDRLTCDSTKHRARRTYKASPHMKRSSLLNGTNRRTNTDACGSIRPVAVVSRPLLPKANGAMTKSRSCSGRKMRRIAASTQRSPTAEALTLGVG